MNLAGPFKARTNLYNEKFVALATAEIRHR
jgi:hypothetical protein